jgi:hypothetical protein
MLVGWGSSSVELNLWNPVYALAPFVLLMVSIPLATFAVITTSIAVTLLAWRVAVVYVQLSIALIEAWVFPSFLKPSIVSPPSPHSPSPNRQRHHRIGMVSSTSSQETIVPAAKATQSANDNTLFRTSFGRKESTRDYESVGGWRAPGDDDEEALWKGINSRLQLPADISSRRHQRGLVSSSSPGQRLSWSPEAIRMSPVQSRARTPVRFAAEEEDDYFPPQPSTSARRMSNASETPKKHKRRKSGSSTSSTSSGLMMATKEPGE